MNKNLGLILVVVGVIFIAVTVLFTTPKVNTEQKLVEAKLNEEQMQYLIKEMQKCLTASENINLDTTFTLDEMIKFAVAYTIYLDKTNEYTFVNEDAATGTADVNKIKENINLIFGVSNVQLSQSSFEVKNGKIEVPLNLQGGDATVYKFKQRNNSSITGATITDIDCLEPATANDKTSLLNKSEYNKEDVLYTLQIKYKVVDERKVLLAYSIYSNYEY